MIRVEHNVVIQRPPADVFARVADVETWPAWNETAREARITSPGRRGVGATFQLTGQVLGRPLQVDHVVTEYEPHHRFAARTLSGPFQATGTYVLDPVDGGTRLTLVMEGEPGGAMKLAGPMIARTIKKQIETQVDHLKRLLETP